MKALLSRTYSFYRDGLAAMTIGRTLWKIIIIKLIIIFGVIRFFFMPDVLNENFADAAAKADHVAAVLTRVTPVVSGAAVNFKTGGRDD